MESQRPENIKEIILNNLKDFNQQGINIEFIQPKDTLVKNLIEQEVTISDPTVNDRVRVTLRISPFDDVETVLSKIDFAKELQREVIKINAFKYKAELLEDENQKAYEAYQDEINKNNKELRKTSPFIFDYLESNMEDEFKIEDGLAELKMVNKD